MTDMPPPPPPAPPTTFNRWAPVAVGGVVAFVVAAFAITLFGRPDPELRYYVEPPAMEVGNVTDDHVELSGKQCFSAANVRTESSEVWRFAGGSSLRPPGFAPFYRAGSLAVEYGDIDGAIPLDAFGCTSFVAFEQPIPADLAADLADTCATPRMFVELVITATDLDTGAVSDRIVWPSEQFRLNNACN